MLEEGRGGGIIPIERLGEYPRSAATAMKRVGLGAARCR